MSDNLKNSSIENDRSHIQRTDKGVIGLPKSPKKKSSDKMLSCRYELKYRISEAHAGAIAAFIRPYLHRDKYALSTPSGDYPISSLYYDSDTLRLCKDTQEGRSNRFKLRVRTYSDEPGSPCFFEVKRRINNVILKGRARVKKDDIPMILSGRIPDSVYKEDEQVLRQFLLYKDSLNARPLMLIRYDRQAFEGDTTTRVRVTFDRNLHYKPVTTPEVEVYGPNWHRVPLNFVILEIKFTQRFPAWLSNMVKCFNLKQSAFSKYVSTIEQSNSLGASSPIMMMRQ
ncbi:MAG: polyphosphate polymerase domain-containing protein [Phycisphaerae bacterium]|nr:polyphosphate polymerase domain-containing protein [Phycisphaerae bacterium]